MRRLALVVLVSILQLLPGCVDPLELKIDGNTGKLVVDGAITNEQGPYTVKLSISKPYASYADSWSAVVRDATVIISDDKGNQETLVETEPGIYKTSINGIQGVIGNTYTLTIRTREGREYTSSPETLNPVPEINNLYFEVGSQQILNEENIEETLYTADVYIDAQDPEGVKNYYMWEWNGTFEVNTQPWDYSEKVRGVRVPMPKECCQLCWVSSRTNTINVLDDRLINGKELKRHLVTRIPIEEKTFGTKYHVDVKQLSISEAAFDYWSTIKTQIANVGSIQDPPPATIIGNITSTTNPEDRALGFFAATAVSSKAFFIRREELSIKPGEFIFPDDCRVITNSTTDRPFFW